MTEAETGLISTLIQGHRDFREHTYKNNRGLFRNLAQQRAAPKYLVVSSADNQIDPSLLTNCNPADLLMIKNIGGFIPAYRKNSADISMMASLDFALSQYAIQHIIILGHRHCQSVRCLIDKPQEASQFGYAKRWFSHYAQAIHQLDQAQANLTLEEQSDICEKLCLCISLKNLLSYKWIDDRVQANELFIHAWYFDIDNGQLQVFNQETAEFQDLDDSQPLTENQVDEVPEAFTSPSDEPPEQEDQIS